MRLRTHLPAVLVLLAWIGLLTACNTPPPAPAPKEQPAAPKPITAEERVRWYQACWDDFNQKKWPEFKDCYGTSATSSDGSGRTFTGPDAIAADGENFTKGFPDTRGDGQLILVNGNHIAGIYLLTGTNSGPMKTPDGKDMPNTNKKIGLLFGHSLDLEPNAPKATKELGIMDGGTFASQLGLSKNPARPLMEKGEATPKVVVARNDATETKNVDTDKAGIEAWNKRDLAGYYGPVADDFVMHAMVEAKDQNKTQSTETDKGFWKAFSDARITVSSMWGAGDYVVTTGTFEGTNDGAVPAMKLPKTGKKVSLPFMSVDRFGDGKIKESWLFYDGATFAGQLGLK